MSRIPAFISAVNPILLIIGMFTGVPMMFAAIVFSALTISLYHLFD